MGEQVAYARVRMLISSMFEGLVNGNRMADIYFERKIIRYSAEFELKDMGGGVILIREPPVELLTEGDLVDMGFGC
ncbi:MAG: hypothetical protein O8C66_02205 [Candidatus Methanoperedens sp.]|nr:hypothetical protein [Candidatus Methanoperedens sp.]MCZ7369299.1 hypothetical protein [Candidatus Methanoperedens sp.]